MHLQQLKLEHTIPPSSLNWRNTRSTTAKHSSHAGTFKKLYFKRKLEVEINTRQTTLYLKPVFAPSASARFLKFPSSLPTQPKPTQPKPTLPQSKTPGVHIQGLPHPMPSYRVPIPDFPSPLSNFWCHVLDNAVLGMLGGF
jgi:hypothetical protein